MKTIQPQRLRPRYYEHIEDQIQAIFYDVIFKRVMAVVKSTNDQLTKKEAHGMLNASANPLQTALRSGRIQYADGIFSGALSSDIVRVLRAIGARWDSRSKIYRLDVAQVPGWVKVEAAAYQETARVSHSLIKKTLDDIQSNLADLLSKKQIHAKRTMMDIQKDFNATVTPVAEAIAIKPELSQESAQRLADDYSKNMKLYIEDFSKKMIGDLRQDVEKNATAGYRFDKMIDAIKRRYSVTQSKAKFLARQETALFMSQYRKERFSEAGVTHYRWSTSHDERVRPTPETTGIARLDNHRRLDGRTFAYADPPVVDLATGRKANPGQDYNCRCVDIPILEAITEAA